MNTGKTRITSIFLSHIFLSAMPNMILTAKSSILTAQLSCQNGSWAGDVPQPTLQRHARCRLYPRPKSCVGRSLRRQIAMRPSCQEMRGRAHPFAVRFFLGSGSPGRGNGRIRRHSARNRTRIKHGFLSAFNPCFLRGYQLPSSDSWFCRPPIRVANVPTICQSLSIVPQNSKQPQDVILSRSCLRPVSVLSPSCLRPELKSCLGKLRKTRRIHHVVKSRKKLPPTATVEEH